MPIGSFIGSLLTRGVSALGRFFTGGAAATTGRAIATIGAGTAAGIAVGNIFGGDGDTSEDGAIGKRVRTIVQTVDAEGNVVRQKVLRGSPFLMRRDFIIAKRVNRLSGKLTRFSNRIRSPSKMKMFTDAVLDNALRKQLSLPCPT